ncbi:MAG: ribosome-binding factor A [Nitriliruptoraceae bacterium]
MARKRNPRIESLVKSAIADLIETELNDPRVAFVTVTDVEVTPDHDVVTVHYTSLDPELVSGDPRRSGGDRVPDPDQIADGLASAAPRLRALLVKRVEMRMIPEVRFRRDPTAVQSAKIDQMLRDLRTGEG